MVAFPDSAASSYQRSMAVLRFQCPECGFGDYEVGHPTDNGAIYCVVCLEENDRLIRTQRWEEANPAQARLRFADAA
jgi:hypothetical protein